MDSNAPRSQVDLPHKTLMDLPNEVIARVCEFLVPDRSEPRPFRQDEINVSMRKERVDGYDNFYVVEASEENTSLESLSYIVPQQGVFYSRIWDGEDERMEVFSQAIQSRGQASESSGPSSLSPNDGIFDSWDGFDMQQTREKDELTRSENRTGNSLANFAAACKRFGIQVQHLHNRHKFHMTISNHGITFEGLRSGAPLQTYRAIPVGNGPVARGTKQQTWAMLDPIFLQVVEVSKGSLPGNIAFGGISRVIKNIRKLNIHVALDMDPSVSKKVPFFLDQIGSFLSSQPANESRRSTLEVDVKLGFHAHALRPRRTDLSEAQQELPISVANTVCGVGQNTGSGQTTPMRTISQIAIPHTLEILKSLTACLSQLLVKHNHRVCSSDEGKTSPPLSVRLRLLGDGPGTRWGDLLFISPVFRNTLFPLQRITMWVEFGSFEDFCMAVQRGFSSSQVPNTAFKIDGGEKTCGIILFGPEEQSVSESVENMENQA
ncbi:hypothetical protein H2200_005491 [Cladophialophora chaetospira]|uniref:Uncharacterized protein n=1 Tax=Cladophialophora chaetospira TaxID=386627 RepID=A0AA38XCS1_9EURO|nr:hypothetical protein H2200_005491 [Cladophialophora chaetospira]